MKQTVEMHRVPLRMKENIYLAERPVLNIKKLKDKTGIASRLLLQNTFK